MNLREITGLDGLESLAVLKNESCESLTRVFNLSILKNLKQLKIEYCMDVREVTGFEGLESLEELELTDFPM
ncbi:hypothetical protein LINGRAPRIM_LOCUS2455 [Linum grandiflorum]